MEFGEVGLIDVSVGVEVGLNDVLTVDIHVTTRRQGTGIVRHAWSRNAVQKSIDISSIHEAVTGYLSRVGSRNLSGPAADQVLATATAASELESIGDIIENNLAHQADVCARNRIILNDEVKGSLHQYLDQVNVAVESAVAAFVSDDHAAANKVLAMKDEISGMDVRCRAKQVRTMQDQPEAVDFAAYSLQSDIRENLKRIRDKVMPKIWENWE